MAPKAEDAPAEGAEAEKSAEDDDKKPKEKRYVWNHKINDRVSSVESLPASFQPSGTLRGDYMQVAKAISQCVPHPAFKPQKTKGSKNRTMLAQQQAKERDGFASGENQDEEPAVFTIHSVRLDRISALILGLILPVTNHLKVIRLLDCRLDPKMLRLLRKGFSEDCSVECLQIEWNPFVDEASPQHTVRSEPTDGDTDDAGNALANFLDDDNVLECLSLRACALARNQIVPMADMITKCKPWQLRQLNLWDNAICDAAATDLAAAFEEYRGLEYLGLGRNRISDEGAIIICRPFATEILDAAKDETQLETVRARIKEQQEAQAAQAKAKAKAKAAPKARPRREAVSFVDTLDELEERPPTDGVDPAQPSWAYRKHSEIKTLSLMENPIRNVATLQKLQPFGPRRAELTVLGTPAADTLLAKYPDLSTKDRKAFCFPSSGQNADVLLSSDGWLLRLG